MLFLLSFSCSFAILAVHFHSSLSVFFSRSSPFVGTVAINLPPRKGSWGGANQWTSQLSRWFIYNGWRVQYDLKKLPDAIVMTHTGLSAGTSFGVDEVAVLKKQHPCIPCLHRINDNDLRKESSAMNDLLARSNRVADHTVFVSSWLRDHHASQWFDVAKPHSVITPGADPRFFHPLHNRGQAINIDKKSDKTKPTLQTLVNINSLTPIVRLVTHHWSDNWNKGFDIYQKMDEFIAAQDSKKFELWIIGRWPQEIQWKAARTFAPASGAELASLLRQCHGYVSASRYEPGAMHVAEGLQCGLPLLYHRDSGGTVEQGLRYGMEIQEDLETTLTAFAKKLPELRSQLLANPPSGSKMALEYQQLIQKIILENGRKEK